MRNWKVLPDYWTAALLYVLVNLVVFHGGWYKYFCEPKSYAGNVYGRVDVLKSVERKSNRKVIALVGDSITEEGIDAELLSRLLGQPVVNLALPGTSPTDWSFFLRAIDPDQNRFHTIVFTIIPDTTRTQPHEDGIQTLLPVTSPFLMREYLSIRKRRNLQEAYLAFDRIYAFRRDLRDLILRPARWSTLTTARKEHLDWVRNYEGQTYDVCSMEIEGSKIIRWGSIKDPEVRRLIRHNVNRTSKLNHAPQVSGIIEPLRSIVQSYTTSGTRIVINKRPIRPATSGS